MSTLRSLALGAVLCACALPALASRPPPPWWRAPVLPQVFHFSGEITPTVLRGGAQVATDNDMPAAWAGGEIHGSFTLIPDRAEGGDGMSGFDWTDGNPEYGRSGNWFTVSITNPDGSVFTLPADAPGPSPMGPDSSGHVHGDFGNWEMPQPVQQVFEAERTFSNASFEQSFELDLGTTFGDWQNLPPLLTFPFTQWPGGYLQGVQIDATQAGYTNVGSLSQIAANGASYAYSFTINRLVHMAPVPEPATWAMLLGGLALTGAAARRRAKRSD